MHRPPDPGRGETPVPNRGLVQNTLHADSDIDTDIVPEGCEKVVTTDVAADAWSAHSLSRWAA